MTPSHDDIATRLASLEQLPAAPGVVSVYLNTRWSDEHQRDRTRVFLVGELRRARAAGMAAPDDLDWVEREGEALVAQADLPDVQGVALFALPPAGVARGDRTTLFLCGDVMTGRGIDQILMCPSAPEIPESDVHDAREYVRLAERASGRIPRLADPAYVWGDALMELRAVCPDARVVNLEVSVTRSADYWADKGINYRMHPGNVTCLTAAGIDVCVLANNHALDYGYRGLEETLATLTRAGLNTAGAGRTLRDAQRPAIVERPGGRRVHVFSFGTATSGIPPAWSATEDRPGVDVLKDLSDATADAIVERACRVKRPGSVVVASVHWGSNWGYEVPRDHVRFAHRLVDGGVDIVHGHSSHHPRPIEVYRDRLVLYGCGDFINDYEGIPGYEQFRDDLVLMYFALVESATGRLVALRMVPLRIHRMRLDRATPAEAEWQCDRLSRICGGFGSRVEMTADRRLWLRWPAFESCDS